MNDGPQDHDELTGGEAARLLGKSRQHVNRLAHDGKIKARQIAGHYWVFKRADVEAYKAHANPKVGRPRKTTTTRTQ